MFEHEVRGRPVHVFATEPPGNALAQLYEAMGQEYVVAGAGMADMHHGYSLPIGGVVATDGVLVPAWVGYDIGCGVCALRLGHNGSDVRARNWDILEELERRIPIGHRQNADGRGDETISRLSVDDLSTEGRNIAEQANWLRARGTMGGNNHFIEIGVTDTEEVWAAIHSGSRGVGKRIAEHYMRLACGGPKAREGHYGLRVDTELGQAYLNDLQWLLAFALENRLEMMHRVVAALDHVIGSAKTDWSSLINRNHNHAERDGQGRWVHRKGATHAESGMLGVIPGNRADGFFVVRGKGDPRALSSSSHGAGRVMGRGKVAETIDMEEYTRQMAGIAARVSPETREEAPRAYKNVYSVLADQVDLLDVVLHAKPVVNVKAAKIPKRRHRTR